MRVGERAPCGKVPPDGHDLSPLSPMTSSGRNGEAAALASRVKIQVDLMVKRMYLMSREILGNRYGNKAHFYNCLTSVRSARWDLSDLSP